MWDCKTDIAYEIKVFCVRKKEDERNATGDRKLLEAVGEKTRRPQLKLGFERKIESGRELGEICYMLDGIKHPWSFPQLLQ